MSHSQTPGLNRRSFLNASAAGLAAIGIGAADVGCGSAARGGSGAAGGASKTGPGLAAAVLDAFKTYRLVGLGEGHQLQEHHDVLETLLEDPGLPGVVDDIVVEFGNALYQDTVDEFVLGDMPVTDSKLRPAWQDTTQSPVETWDAPVYEQFFRRVRAVNWTLPPGKRIRVLLGDPPIDWANVTTFTQWGAFIGQREAHAAAVIEQQVVAKGRRALLCYGGGHLLHTNAVPGKHLGDTIVSLIEQSTGVRTYTINDLTYFAGDPGGLAAKLSGYHRNTVIPTAGTWLGSFDADLVIPDTHTHGGTNPYCGIPLGKLQDAGCYLGQPAALTASSPNLGTYFDPTYWNELQRRNAIEHDPINLDSYRQPQSARYPLPPLPGSCG